MTDAVTEAQRDEADPGSQFLAVLKRDLLIARRIGGGGLLAVVFFALVATLVPLGVGARLDLLQAVAPGILWVGILLAGLLTLDRMFQSDLEDGSLDLMLTTGMPLAALALAKAAGHWITTALPLLIATPLVAVLLNLSWEVAGSLATALLLGTPALSLVGAIGAALTVSVRRGGLLLSLLVLPLIVPTLIFGVLASSEGALFSPSHMLLAATSLFALVVSPPATAAALRLNLA